MFVSVCRCPELCRYVFCITNIESLLVWILRLFVCGNCVYCTVCSSMMIRPCHQCCTYLYICRRMMGMMCVWIVDNTNGKREIEYKNKRAIHLFFLLSAFHSLFPHYYHIILTESNLHEQHTSSHDKSLTLLKNQSTNVFISLNIFVTQLESIHICIRTGI